MYEHLSMSERIDRIGALLAKAVYLYNNKEINEEKGFEEVSCAEEKEGIDYNG
ncbi:MAG: hypothetical protein KJ593_07335 [Candidatus Omnitrophica bacterium]|nr:hypothetical protein [Candidatus Omnitrophota bacterium]